MGKRDSWVTQQWDNGCYISGVRSEIAYPSRLVCKIDGSNVRGVGAINNSVVGAVNISWVCAVGIRGVSAVRVGGVGTGHDSDVGMLRVRTFGTFPASATLVVRDVDNVRVLGFVVIQINDLGVFCSNASVSERLGTH